MTLSSASSGPSHLALVMTYARPGGGMEKFTRTLLRDALEAGWHVTVALSGDDLEQELTSSYPHSLKVERVDWVDRSFAGDRAYRWSRIAAARRWFKHVQPSVALFIQSSNTPFRASLLGAWLAGVPIVSTHRTLPYEKDFTPSGRHLGGWIPGLGLHRWRVIFKTWVTAGLSRRIIFNSHAVRRHYEMTYCYPSRKCRVIPNAVHRIAEQLQRATNPGGLVRIGYVGRLGYEKRLDLLIEALARLPNKTAFEAIIFGQGSDEPRLRERARESGLQDRIRWAGATDDPASALNELDIVVLCSPRESSSNMTLEAMAAGKAVVVTDTGGMPELVEHGRCGLIVPPLDASRLADVLIMLIENPAERLRLGVAAREAARLHHAPELVCAGWLDVLEQAAGSRMAVPVRDVTGRFYPSRTENPAKSLPSDLNCAPPQV